ncbi:ABC-2 type transport system permease protein [Caminicella sporogenes DSM 14501]|uniref:ABC-2 type transport system permease protein n=1 Tax=Caminicella sporogenes DSM 14501 TaxID=1121266 RepID=A0A1M6PH27_9FIRM|nr:DUF6449 domain-containing protein [Caminicella sporogenes]RKD21402.1 hypothetical protein BET04_08150 [Caminicella sporogenes]SHK07251.1 ABC-2 type transport system permease protein [Caminicella sporogenes DSM 14501]
MKSAISYFNKRIIREDLKRFWGIGALYFLALIFTGPIMFLISSNESDMINFNIERYFNIYSHGFQITFSVIFPILLATLIFRYIQVKSSAGMIHSFPFTRNILFNSHILSNLIIISIPVFINFIIMFLVYKGLYTGEKIVMSDVYKWFFITLLINYTVLFMTVFAGMISGVSFIQSVLSLIFLFLPLGLTGLVLMALDNILFGFVPEADTFIKDFAFKAIPVTNQLYKEKNIMIIIWYIILLFILFFVSKYLYNKRNLETAGDSITFDILKPLFKYGVAFCTMIIGGLYFSAIGRESSFWLYFGFFIGAVFGYIIAEMIIEKSIWVFNKLWGLLPFIIIAGLFFAIVDFDLIGYEKRLPKISKIESVYFDSYLEEIRLKNDYGLLHSESNIKAVRNLHKMIIDNKSEIQNMPVEESRKHISIGYKLKNGKILVREYNIPKKMFNNNPYIREIYESHEYKKRNKIFKVDVDKISDISIYVNIINKNIVISDKDKVRELVEALKKDILNETYDEIISTKEPWAEINIRCISEICGTKRQTLYLNFKKSYKELEKWFKENGYYEKVRVMPDDIKYAVVKDIQELKDVEKNIYKIADNLEMIRGKKVEIRDKNKIEELLRTYNASYRSSYLKNKKYIVVFYLKNGEMIVGSYFDDDVPNFIKSY